MVYFLYWFKEISLTTPTPQANRLLIGYLLPSVDYYVGTLVMAEKGCCTWAELQLDIREVDRWAMVQRVIDICLILKVIKHVNRQTGREMSTLFEFI